MPDHRGNPTGNNYKLSGPRKVYNYSAATRNSQPTPENRAGGSQASQEVTNGAFQGPGEGMAQVRSTYRQSRKAGFSPDGAREQALFNRSNYSGSGHGPTMNMYTDYQGRKV